MNIRSPLPSDLEQIVNIHNQAITTGAIGYTKTFNIDERMQWLQSHTDNRPLIIAELKGDVVGWANLTDYRSGRDAFQNTAEISYHVHSNHTRNGIATALVKHLIGLCPSIEISTLLAIILKSNLASASLLEKLGFLRWAELPDVAEMNNQKGSHLYYGQQIHPQ
ncbi:MAG: L-amino acid N-acyltransferase YncA [Gammaproteobacteria bacterium]|jgi:L-amino acid N-acyltransferase YncA